MIGGRHVVATAHTKLAENDTACRILTIRLEPGDSRISFGAEGADEPHGYLVATSTSGESWTFGPFGAGMGIKPSEIYIWGTAADELWWNGLEA